MNLFQDGALWGTSGINLEFKIDCDALSDSDIRTLAQIARRRLVYPSKVIPVPTGGNRLAKELAKQGLVRTGNTVIVDDVWTTGTSVLKVAVENNLLDKLGSSAQCLVIFARGSYPHWVRPLFTINSVLKAQNFLWQEKYV